MEIKTTIGNAVSTVRRIVPFPRFVDTRLATLQFRLYGLRFEGEGRGIGSLRQIEDDEVVASWPGLVQVVEPDDGAVSIMDRPSNGFASNHPDAVFIQAYSPDYDKKEDK